MTIKITKNYSISFLYAIKWNMVKGICLFIFFNNVHFLSPTGSSNNPYLSEGMQLFTEHGRWAY